MNISDIPKVWEVKLTLERLKDELTRLREVSHNGVVCAAWYPRRPVSRFTGKPETRPSADHTPYAFVDVPAETVAQHYIDRIREQEGVLRSHGIKFKPFEDKL